MITHEMIEKQEHHILKNVKYGSTEVDSFDEVLTVEIGIFRA